MLAPFSAAVWYTVSIFSDNYFSRRSRDLSFQSEIIAGGLSELPTPKGIAGIVEANKMFPRVMIGPNDLSKAKAFYDKLLGTLGVSPE